MKLRHPFLLERIRLDSEEGQTMAEYGMLTAFIALVAVLAFPIFGGAIANLYSAVVSAFPG